MESNIDFWRKPPQQGKVQNNIGRQSTHVHKTRVKLCDLTWVKELHVFLHQWVSSLAPLLGYFPSELLEVTWLPRGSFNQRKCLLHSMESFSLDQAKKHPAVPSPPISHIPLFAFRLRVPFEVKIA